METSANVDTLFSKCESQSKKTNIIGELMQIIY